jgi:serine/threonine protein kinase
MEPDSKGQHETRGQLSVRERIESLSDQFEGAWAAQGRPRIEDFLGRLPLEQQAPLFRQLLEIELSLRQQHGENPLLAEYQSRFPQYVPVVEECLAKLVANRRLGDYELLEELGRGGMGIVYRARQVLLDQIVAIKVLPERYLDSPQMASRFKREMRSIGALEHPNIVRAYNAGEERGCLYLVMEYVEGTTLQELVAQHRRLPVGAACELIRQGALGLQAAHEHGLVHRDIKPANLMLSHDGTVKLLDLGLARLESVSVTQQLTDAGVTMGTVDYMAPEQWDNPSGVDIRADIYSLGCTLFCLLSGQPPYGTDEYSSLRRKMAAHAAAPIPSLASRGVLCPSRLNEVLQQMLAKDPEHRYETPADVIAALVPFADPGQAFGLLPTLRPSNQWQVGSQPGTGRSGDDTLPTRVCSAGAPKSWWGRNRRLVGEAVAGLALLAVALLVMWHRSGTPPVAPAADPYAELAEQVELLPALDGDWWFDEAPWLLPSVRAEIARRLRDPKAPKLPGQTPAAQQFLLNPRVPDVQQKLYAWVKEEAGVYRNLTPLERDLFDQLVEGIAKQPKTDTELKRAWHNAAESFWPAEERHANRPAVDFHTAALLWHKLAGIDGTRASAMKARTLYAVALEKYGAEGGGLPRLCHADLGQLLTTQLMSARERPNKWFEESQQHFEQAVKGLAGNEPRHVLFRASVKIAMAAAFDAAGDTGGHVRENLEDAANFLKRGKLDQHPLWAYATESLAWNRMDCWQIGEAEQLFNKALKLRAELGKDDPTSGLEGLHDRHGLAIVARYGGDINGAKEQFRKLIEDIDRVELARPALDLLTQCYCRGWHDRKYNTAERYADCFLYQGPAAENLATDMAEARKYYTEAENRADKPGLRVSMTYKRCIARAIESAEGAAQAADRLKTLGEENPVAGVEASRTAMLGLAFEAVMAWRGQDRKKLQERLSDLAEDDAAEQRETLELRLLCVQLLLQSALEEGRPADVQRAHAVGEAVGQYDPLFEAFRRLGKADQYQNWAIPFLWPHYDYVIRALEKISPPDALGSAALPYLLAARGRQNGVKQADLLAFHLHAGAMLIVLRLRDGTTKAAILPGVGRQQICRNNLAGSSNPPKLPDDLRAIITAKLRQRQHFRVLWEDRDSFAGSAAGKCAVAETDWPFNDTCTLAELRGQ